MTHKPKFDDVSHLYISGKINIEMETYCDVNNYFHMINEKLGKFYQFIHENSKI